MGLTGDPLLGTCHVLLPVRLSLCPRPVPSAVAGLGLSVCPRKWPPSEALFAVVSLAETGEGRAPGGLGSQSKSKCSPADAHTAHPGRAATLCAETLRRGGAASGERAAVASASV